MMNMKSGFALASVLVLGGSASASILIEDHFSDYSDGALVGQGGWAQLGTPSTNPLMISGGMVQHPGGGNANDQDAVKDPGVDQALDSSFFMGVTINLTSAPTATGGSSYFLAMRYGGFDNARIAARMLDGSSTQYQLGMRSTGQSQNPFVWGAALDLGTTYTLIQEVQRNTGDANDVFSLYVNPLLGQGNNTPYATQTTATGDPADDFNGVVISQFANSGMTTQNAGLTIGDVSLATTFDESLQAVPEPTTLAGLALGALALVRRRRQK